MKCSKPGIANSPNEILAGFKGTVLPILHQLAPKSLRTSYLWQLLIILEDLVLLIFLIYYANLYHLGSRAITTA